MRKWIIILLFFVIGIYGFLFYEIGSHLGKYEELLNTFRQDNDPKKEEASTLNKTPEDPLHNSPTTTNELTPKGEKQPVQPKSNKPNNRETITSVDQNKEEPEKNREEDESGNETEISEEERIAWEEQYRKNLEQEKREVEALQRQQMIENGETEVNGETPPGVIVIKVGSPEYFESFAREYVRSLSSSKWNNYYPEFIQSDNRYAEVNVSVKDMNTGITSSPFIYRVMLDIQGSKPVVISANRIK